MPYRILYPKRRIESYSMMGAIVPPKKNTTHVVEPCILLKPAARSRTRGHCSLKEFWLSVGFGLGFRV